MFSPIMRIQENDTVSSTKEIIKTHVAVKHYYNYSESIVKNTRIRFHYTKGKISKLTVTSMNFHKAGLH